MGRVAVSGATVACSEAFGEAPPLEEVTDALRGPLQRYLQRFVGDRALAEDLLQETLVRMSKGLDAFEGRSSVKTWAFKIATHTAIDQLRRSRRELPLVDIDETALGGNPEEEPGERLVVDEMNACLREEIAIACPRATARRSCSTTWKA